MCLARLMRQDGTVVRATSVWYCNRHCGGILDYDGHQNVLDAWG